MKRALVLAGSLLCGLLGGPLGLSAPGRAAATGCAGQAVALVHDLALDGSSLAGLDAAIAASGRCPRILEYDGRAALEESASVIGAQLAALGAHEVVAFGAGSLVVRRAEQLRALHVTRLIAVGALWQGTNLAQLGTLDQLSRDAGSYDTALQLEHLLLDPACAGCRDVVAGSDFLRRLTAGGIARPGLVDVLTRTDVLVDPWTSGWVSGATNLVVQDVEPSRIVTHYQLPDDAVTQRLVLGRL
jgi:triacylglycerol lipase